MHLPDFAERDHWPVHDSGFQNADAPARVGRNLSVPAPALRLAAPDSRAGKAAGGERRSSASRIRLKRHARPRQIRSGQGCAGQAGSIRGRSAGGAGRFGMEKRRKDKRPGDDRRCRTRKKRAQGAERSGKRQRARPEACAEACAGECPEVPPARMREAGADARHGNAHDKPATASD